MKRSTSILKCFLQFTCTYLDASQNEGGNFLNLLQKEGDTQKRGGGFQPWRKLCYIYSLGKKINCAYLKTTEYEMIVSYAKPFNEKTREQLVKKTRERFFKTFNRSYENKEKIQMCFVGRKILNISLNKKILKETPAQVLFNEISEIFKNTFSYGTPRGAASGT